MEQKQPHGHLFCICPFWERIRFLEYSLIIFEFIQIVHLRRKFNRKNNDDGPDNLTKEKNEEEKEFLKVNIPNQENKMKIEPPQVTPLEEKTQELPVIEPPQITPLKEERSGSVEEPLKRHGSVKADGIKLVDLDKNDGT